MALKIERTHIHGLGPFEDVVIDLLAIPGPVIAVVGPNGSGKTTLLELMTAPWYRTTASAGGGVKLADLATVRDAFVETVAVGECGRFTTRQIVDAVSRKGETLITDADGAPVLNDGKVSEGDPWLAARVPPREVLEAGQVRIQKSDGYLGHGPADRMRVLLRALRLERIEALAGAARDRTKAAADVADDIRAKLADLRRRAPDLAKACEAYDLAVAGVEAAAEARQSAEDAARRAQAAAHDAEHARDIRQRREAARERSKAAQAGLADTRERLGNNRGVLDRADEIRAAVERDAELRAEVLEAQQGARSLDAAQELSRTRIAGYVRASEKAAVAGTRAAQRAAKARAVLADREDVERAAAELPAAQQAVEAGQRAHDEAAAELDTYTAAQLTGKDDRIAGLRGGLGEIVERTEWIVGEWSPADCAETTIAIDDGITAATSEEHGAELRAAKREALHGVSMARTHLESVRNRAGRAAEIERAAADLEAAEADEAAEREIVELRTADIEAEQKDLEAAKGKIAAVVEQISAAQAECGRLAELVKLAPQLEAATTRIPELEQLEATHETAFSEAERELSGLPEVDVPAPDMLREATERAQAAIKAHDQAVELRAGRHAARETAREFEREIVSLQIELTEAEAQHADWKRLAADLGREGLQACEVDAAVPELNALANDLLHTCHGPRFTVEVRADRLGAKGQVIDELEIRVIDSEKGRDGRIESFSPGEQVLCGEAVSLGITQISCRGQSGATLIRDETGAALDPNMGPAYIAMLRQAVAAIDASCVLFVSHNPELWALADSRIEVRGGKVEVRS